MRKYLKLVVFILLVAVITVGFVLFFTQPTKAKTLIVEPKVWEVSFKGKGEIINPKTVEYFSKNGGLISAAYFEDNDYVVAGDLLFKFDTTDYENALKECQNRLDALDGERLQAEINLAQESRKIDVEVSSIDVQSESIVSQIQQLEIQISTQQEHLTYVEEMYSITVAQYNLEGVSRNDVDNAEMAVSDAKSALTSLQAQIDAVNKQIDVLNRQKSLLGTLKHTDISGLLSRIEAEKRMIEDSMAQLKEKIEDSSVFADCSGILNNPLKQGQTIPVGCLLATITTKDPYELESFVQLEDIGSLSIGMVVEATLVQSSGDTVYNATIEDIENEAKLVPGYNNKRVRVVMKMQQSDLESLKPGYTLNIKFVTTSIDDSIIIPKSAVIENDRGLFAIVVEDGFATLRAVEKYDENSANVLIKSGLAYGDTIAVNADKAISEGQRIKSE